jgi:aromatic-L-amino-acid/L-tryptophan decarboxylase
MDYSPRSSATLDDQSLDPSDWDALENVFHAAVTQGMAHVRNVREQPVWRPTPDEVKARLSANLPQQPTPVDQLLNEFAEDMLPYATGNIHPRFFGWVHGSGTLAGALGEMLAAFMNCNVGGRDHVAVYVERQVLAWCKELFSFPLESSGILTSGTSMGTVIALAVARNSCAGCDVRKCGLRGSPRLLGYASVEAHSSIAKAFELLGLGEETLYLVPTDADYRLSLPALADLVSRDRARGDKPFVVIASAGTVNTGAIDDLAAIVQFCREQELWLHIDAAFGGVAILTPEFRPKLQAIREADSLAFDFHKWLQVPYDAGCVLVRDEKAHRSSFSHRSDYLMPSKLGLAGGDPWFTEYGPELSRTFRALKVWFTFKAYGIENLAKVIERNCVQAQQLGREIEASGDLELLAPVSLNIVCFRFNPSGLSEAELDRFNHAIVIQLQVRGIAAPSTTKVGGRTAIRVSLTNHRTRRNDLDALVHAVRRLGYELLRN